MRTIAVILMVCVLSIIYVSCKNCKTVENCEVPTVDSLVVDSTKVVEMSDTTKVLDVVDTLTVSK